MVSMILSASVVDREWTRADLDRLPDDGYRHEIIDGALIVTPAPMPTHQFIVFAVARGLHEACPEGLRVVPGPLDLALDDRTVIQPDVLVAPRSDFLVNGLETPPLVAVEVLSPSTRRNDLVAKRERLQRAGCPHYWLVDPVEPSVTVLDLVDGVYQETAHAVGEAELRVEAPFPVTLVPARLAD